MRSASFWHMTRLAACLLAFTALAIAALPSTAAEPSSDGAFEAIDLTGSWSGYWQSSTNRHHGPLHGEFCKIDETKYAVHFRGRLFRIFPFRYSVTLNVVGVEPGRVILAGDSRLGRMFGTFTYVGSATETNFVANYSSCRYEGQFVLKRCCD